MIHLLFVSIYCTSPHCKLSECLDLFLVHKCILHHQEQWHLEKMLPVY